MEEFKITEDNYKGYCELEKVILGGAGISTHDAKKLIIPELSLMFPGIFCANLNLEIVGALMMLMGFSLPIIASLKNYKDEINRVKTEYPYVNVHISYNQLEKALQEANIIINENGKKVLDVENYTKKIEEERNLIKFEKIKDDYIKETRFENVESSLIVSEDELEKTKQKIKKLTK